MSLPALVLVPGAWHQPEHLAALIAELPGIDIHTVALASSGDDPGRLGDMYQDAALIKRTVAAIEGPVVVMAHSYAGIPTSEGLVGADNVRRIIYLAAFQIDVGESLLSSAGGTPPPWWKLHQEDGVGDYLEALDPVEVFYGDVDPDIAREAVARLGYQSYACKVQEQTQAAWHTIPSTYIACDADNALPPVAQTHFANRAGRVARMATSHSPFLCRPSALAELIKAELAS